MDGEETFLLQTAETGKRTPNKLRPQGERRYPCIFMYKIKGRDDLINPLPAHHDYDIFKFVLLSGQVTVILCV